MITLDYAKSLIPASDNSYRKHKSSYNTKDIVQLMIWADKRTKGVTEKFSKTITPDEKGLRKLFDFLARNIRYKKDPPGAQWVKSPARLLADQEGDCKSFTLFITSVLRNLEVAYKIRFVNELRGARRPNHVYPVAILPSGKELVMDVTYTLQKQAPFGAEVNYHYKKDYKVKPKEGLAYLSGTEGQPETVLDDISSILNSIPDSVLKNDVTKMSSGELQRELMAQRMDILARQSGYVKRQDYLYAAKVIRNSDLAGVGAVSKDMARPIFDFIQASERMTAPAFKAPKLVFTNVDEISGLFSWLKKVGQAVGKGVKNAAQAVANVFKEAWRKLMNWIFKGPIQAAAPFFLYTFIKKAVKKGEVKRRQNKQKDVTEFLVKAGIGRENLNAAIGNGVLEKTGSSPAAILNGVVGQQIAGSLPTKPIGPVYSQGGGLQDMPINIPKPSGGQVGGLAAIAAFAIKAVGFVINIIGKVAKLFKKQKPSVNESDTSDLEVLQEEFQQEEKNKPDQASSDGAGGMVATLAALVLVPKLLGG